MHIRLGSMLLLGACGSPDDDEAVGQGLGADVRLISDVFTWGCTDVETGEDFQGVSGHDVYLEVAPDSLADRTLPAVGGCTTELELFPQDAGAGAWDDPDLGEDLLWQSSSDNGYLRRKTVGFWANAEDGAMGCVRATEKASVELVDGGELSGVVTPVPVGDAFVTFDDGVDDGLEFGEEVEITWDQSGWEASWVQLRREKRGEVWESVVCNTTGQNSVIVDGGWWDELDPKLNVEETDIYVGFQVSETQTLSDGRKAELLTRSLAQAVD